MHTGNERVELAREHIFKAWSVLFWSAARLFPTRQLLQPVVLPRWSMLEMKSRVLGLVKSFRSSGGCDAYQPSCPAYTAPRSAGRDWLWKYHEHEASAIGDGQAFTNCSIAISDTHAAPDLPGAAP